MVQINLLKSRRDLGDYFMDVEFKGRKTMNGRNDNLCIGVLGYYQEGCGVTREDALSSVINYYIEGGRI